MLTVLRHGLEEAPEVMHGWQDVGLQAVGVDQANRASDVLRGVEFKHAYTSDLKRAAKTAEAVMVNRGMNAEPVAALRSLNLGLLAGRPWAEMGPKLDALWTEWRNGNEGLRAPEGESWADYQGRLYPFMFRMAEEAGNANVLAVAHSHVCDYAAAVAANGGRPLFGPAIDLVRRFETQPGDAVEIRNGRVARMNYIQP